MAWGDEGLFVAPTMNTFGHLIHEEELDRDGVRYRITVFRVQGGLHGKWSCASCQVDGDESFANHPTVEEAVANTKAAISQHHAEKHSG